MNVPLAIPLPTITCCHSGCVSNSGGRARSRSRSGRRSRRRRRARRRARAPGTTGPSRSGSRAAPRRARRPGSASPSPPARPEVAVLVVAGRDRDVQLARARDERPVGRDADRGVVAAAVAVALGALVQRRVHVTRPSPRAIRRANAVVGPSGIASARASASGVGVGRRSRSRARASAPAGRRAAPRASAASADPLRQRRLVRAGVRMPALLHRADAERAAGRLVDARERAQRLRRSR